MKTVLILILFFFLSNSAKEKNEYNAPVIQIDEVTYQAVFTDNKGKKYRVTFYIGETLEGNLYIK